ncbi:MAG: Maf family protein [Acidobacteriaceae bacterium]|nr:Maf family protein [Acidobacteriaceae bacterium]
MPETQVQAARLILASGSPRRRELLSQAGYVFAVEAADVDESQREGEEAGAYVLRLAEEKAQAVYARIVSVINAEEASGVIVLGADTSVVLGEEVLGKPVDADDARRMLRKLSARTHRVLTGVAAVSRCGTISEIETTEVLFAQISEPELEVYCATAEPLDKAGAYGIQGYAARWIPRINGCYFNVMGLPIARTVRMIEEVRARCEAMRHRPAAELH